MDEKTVIQVDYRRYPSHRESLLQKKLTMPCHATLFHGQDLFITFSVTESGKQGMDMEYVDIV